MIQSRYGIEILRRKTKRAVQPDRGFVLPVDIEDHLLCLPKGARERADTCQEQLFPKAAPPMRLVDREFFDKQSSAVLAPEAGSNRLALAKRDKPARKAIADF